ncbi:MAG: triose-phosphate isomerase [Candidatus Pacebacteria bacterium]|nr:triose-phosphate isomerase [Candidatus Paceibacterota bacterium]
MKPLIIANWKANPGSVKEAKRLFKAIPYNRQVVICPPSCYFYLGKKHKLGSQNCFLETGAFTGELSPEMLKSLRIDYVILGHSERREYFKETDELIREKVKACLKEKLKVILCVGEKKGQNTLTILKRQLSCFEKGIFAVAYEPVWAIGTGNFCNPEKAKKALDFIKKRTKTKVLYGGSVNSSNFKQYLKQGFDGVLVGGASLNIKELKKMI